MPVIRSTYPYVVALAYTLPILHQSALGALMLLTGNQVFPLWQTPMLPLLYVWAAAFIGTPLPWVHDAVLPHLEATDRPVDHG